MRGGYLFLPAPRLGASPARAVVEPNVLVPYAPAMSTLFLFGAGASAYSGECQYEGVPAKHWAGDPGCPPLGNDLFSALQAGEGVAATLSSSVRAALEANFEEGVSRMTGECSGEIHPLLHQTGAFLKDFFPTERNYYRRLIRHLVKASEAACFATLNYDLLIERSVLAEHRFIACDEADVVPGRFSVLKLHGSCHFVPDLWTPQNPNGMRANIDCKFEGIGPTYQTHLRVPWKRELKAAALDSYYGTHTSAPVMAVYGPGKPVLVNGQEMSRWLDAFETQLHAARRIVIVGVKYVADDAHIWARLANAAAPILYVDPYPDGISEWPVSAEPSRVRVLSSEFGCVVERIEQEGVALKGEAPES